MAMASSVKLFQVLELLCQDGPVKAMTLSRELGFNKSSIHRFLNTLMEMGYVVQDNETGLYSASLKVYELGVQVKNRFGISKIAAPILWRLQVEVNAAVNLGVLQNNEMLTLERFTPDDENVKIIVKAKLPAYCTALGKILLAYLDEESFERYMATTELKAITRRTVTDPAEFRAMIAQIRNNGLAVDDRELDENIRSIATPVRDESGLVVAGLSITAAATRLAGEDLAEAQRKLYLATDKLCTALGNTAES